MFILLGREKSKIKTCLYEQEKEKKRKEIPLRKPGAHRIP
jgi:hypothetical protein